MNRVRVRVPASSANVGPGFDAIGIALNLYTTITMGIAEETRFTLIGAELAQLPTDKSNLLYETAAFLFEKAGQPVPELSIEVETEVPLTRGLGSSAQAIVGALVAANQLAGVPFSDEQLFSMASHMEGHPDNVGASFFGGIVVATMPEEAGGLVPYVRITPPAALKALVIIPDFTLSTAKARSTLPEAYTKKDAIYNVGRSSLLVAALAQGRLELLKEAMKDAFHQPYRMPLVPGLGELIEKAPEHGALGAALSGAGPTILCFFSDDQAEESLLAFAKQVMAKHNITYHTHVLLPDQAGVSIQAGASLNP